jgi:hypothetical protein
MDDRTRNRRGLVHGRLQSWLWALSVAGSLGCRTSVDDVHRWANTQQGPGKIVAVMTHDKYPDDLRIEAAMTLVRMKPRAGRRVGIDELVAGLRALPAQSRHKLVSGMLPLLEREILKPPPPEPPSGAAREPDTTFPYKDAAFALLTNPSEELVVGGAERERLKATLGSWAMADFSSRMDDPSQAYGMGQMLADLGPDGVRRLPELLVVDAKKVSSIAGFVADHGDEATKLEASTRLVAIAREVDSAAWLARKAPILKQANEASGYKVEGARFDEQLALYQEEELLRVFASLKQIGQAPAVDYLLEFASDTKRPEKRREAALAAMEGRVDRKNDGQVARLLAIASANDTPDSVREQALRRVGELPRKQVIDSLYGLFGHANWKVRWVAAELVLKMSDTSQLEEFMGKLGRLREMAMTESLRYGKLIAALPGTPAPRELVGAYTARTKPVAVRLAALGYYLDQGSVAELPMLGQLGTDSARVPPCPKGAADCEWTCEIESGGQRVAKAVSSVGEFVQYCVVPAIAARAAAEHPTTAQAPGGAEQTAKN